MKNETKQEGCKESKKQTKPRGLSFHA